MEITKQQVLEMSTWGNSRDQLKVKEWFPEAFKVELEVGKVYKASGCIFYYQEANKSYGFSDGEWSKPSQWVVCEGRVKDPSWVISKATTAEWHAALIAEAKKRGYKNGNYECLISPNFTHLTGSDFEFYKDEMRLSTKDKSVCIKQNIIFKNGIWAEIIKTFSKEEAEKLLGGKII
jgi:hypothetical protein